MPEIKDVMTPTVECASPDDGLRVASEKMKSCAVDPLPVCEDGRLVGMVTERDLQRVAQEKGLAAGMTPVREAMLPQVLYCFDDQDLTEAADLMTSHPDAPGLVVLNRERRLVGILTAAKLEGNLDVKRARKEPEGEMPFPDYDRDAVDYMSEESFPASDPPPPPTFIAPDEDDES